MAGGETRQSHASVRLLRREGCDQPGVQHNHRAGSLHSRDYVWWSADARRIIRPVARHPGSGIASFLRHGFGSGIFHRSQLGTPDHQPYLFADVVLQRPLGPDHVPAESSAEDALVLPPYHLSQLALGAVGAGTRESVIVHWEALAAFTMICLGI